MPSIRPSHRPSIDILFGDPQVAVRTLLRSALVDEGFRSIHDYAHLESIRTDLDVMAFDLVIVDAQMTSADGTDDACTVLSDLRAGRLGRNPFVPVIMTSWPPPPELVKRVADSGADDLLVKPVAPGTVLDRIDALVHRRKPFVVTSDYIGPDRRQDHGRGSTPVPLFTVPNTLEAKIKGQAIDPVALETMIARSRQEIDDQRVKRQAFQIAFLLQLATTGLSDGKTDGMAALNRIVAVAEDAAARAAGTPYANCMDLCQTLADLIRTIGSRPDGVDARGLALVKNLSDALLIACHPGEQAGTMTEQIAAAIKSYRARLAS
ncbi:MAG: response regulator [Azospirillaceae bacterium]|nr:response regulator [Azospirillaceae bacterium]